MKKARAKCRSGVRSSALNAVIHCCLTTSASSALHSCCCECPAQICRLAANRTTTNLITSRHLTTDKHIIDRWTDLSTIHCGSICRLLVFSKPAVRCKSASLFLVIRRRLLLPGWRYGRFHQMLPTYSFLGESPPWGCCVAASLLVLIPHICERERLQSLAVHGLTVALPLL